jgi:cyd operon protein YbgT
MVGQLTPAPWKVEEDTTMWYFSWILGVLLACAFGIINVMWMETEEMLGSEEDGGEKVE